MRAQRKLEGGPKRTPHTIESLREKDETIITDINSDENQLIRSDLESDEFSDYYKSSYEPKVLITYSDNPLRVSLAFVAATVCLSAREITNDSRCDLTQHLCRKRESSERNSPESSPTPSPSSATARA